MTGVLFIDEVMPRDKMLTAGEPTIIEALTPWLAIQGRRDEGDGGRAAGPREGDCAGSEIERPAEDVPINEDGSFTVGELIRGSYQVELPVNDDMVAAALAAAGVKFVGKSEVVAVAAGGKETVNFPFQITMQTISVSANMGVGDDVRAGVEGVKLTLHAQADGTGDLGEQTTDKNGMATFDFARDLDTGPGGGMDHIVFVRVAETGNDALTVTANEFTEIEYMGVDRVSHAPRR